MVALPVPRLSARHQRAAARLLQAAIWGILVAGVATRNLSVVVNAGLSLGVTFVPAVLARDFRIPLSPGMALWVTTALFLHSLGMLGVYGSVWWFDHVTHLLSATLVAGAGYVVVRAVDEYRDDIYLPPEFTAAFVLLVTVALGVFWEVIEFGARIAAERLAIGPVLIQYGLVDTLLDLVFDTIGALAVTLFATDRFETIVAAVTDRLRTA